MPDVAIPPTQLLRVADLAPWEKNPRRINPAALARLYMSVDEYGHSPSPPLPPAEEASPPACSASSGAGLGDLGLRVGAVRFSFKKGNLCVS
jgi:hypothetical protein